MNRTIIVPLPNTSFRVGMLLLIFKTIGSMSRIIPYSDTVDAALSVAATFFLVLSILSQKFSLRILMWYAIVVVMAAITSFQVKSLVVLMSAMICIALRGEDLSETIRFIFFYESLLFVMHVSIAFLMMASGDSMSFDYSNQIRYPLGFSHPNTCSILLANLTTMWVWLHYDELKVKHIINILLIHISFYLFTKCRTALGVTLVFCVLLLVFYHNEKNKKCLAGITALVVPVLSVAVYWLISRYTAGNPIILYIDKMLSSRIKLGAYAFENYGLSLLGQDMTEIQVIWDGYWGLSSHTFDNLYSYFIVNFGVVWLMLVSVLFFKMAMRAEEKNNIVILLWAVYGMAEVHPLNPLMFFPLMLVSCLLEKKTD